MATTDLATDATDKVQAFIDKLADAGSKIIDAANPAIHTAAEAAFTAVMVGGVVAVGRSIVLLVVAAAIVKYGALALFAKSQAAPKQYGSLGEAGFAYAMAAGAACVAAGVITIASLVDLLSASTWLAIFRPDAAIAARVLGL